MKSFADLSKFQLIVIGVFSAFILAGVLIFAVGGLGSRGGEEVARATIWGTLSSSGFREAMMISGLDKNESLDINYVQKNESSFDQELLEALASQTGPDLIIISGDNILRQRNRIIPVPYENYTERDFRDNFLSVGEIYLSPEGILGFPFAVDPLVMYWNRDMFTNAAILEPPKIWSQFHNLANALTQRIGTTGISESAVALGEFRNINNATEILSAMIIQAGNPISVSRDSEVQSVMNQRGGQAIAPAVSALTFFTEFSNPLKTSYSWNRSLPPSRDYFISGDLAVYFGFASELPLIQAGNPNLNFDIASLPQTANTSNNITYGRTRALSLVRGSKDLASALRIATALTSSDFIQALSQVTGLPPIRKDLADSPPPTRFDPVFYRSAIQSRSWVNPGKTLTDNTFLNMVESVTAGRENATSAVNRAHSELQLEFNSSFR